MNLNNDTNFFDIKINLDLSKFTSREVDTYRIDQIPAAEIIERSGLDPNTIENLIQIF